MRTTRREVLILDRGENTLTVVQDRYRRTAIADGDGLRHYGGWLGDVPCPGSTIVIEYVHATEPKPLVIVDSCIAFIEGNENDAMVMRAFMRQCRTLATLGAGVVVIHHSGKGESSKQYRGSSDLKAAVDVAYVVEGFSDPTRLERLRLTAFKGRIATRSVIPLRFDGRGFYYDSEASPRPVNVTDKLRDLLVAHPGSGKTAFIVLAVKKGFGRNQAAAFLEKGVQQGTVRREHCSRNMWSHTWVGAVAEGNNDSGVFI
jgi:hypothetical protein